MLEVLLETSREKIVEVGKEKIKRKYEKKINQVKRDKEEYKEKGKKKLQDVAKDKSDEFEEELWKRRRLYMIMFDKKIKQLLRLRDVEIDQFVRRTTKLSPKQITIIVSASSLIALSFQAARAIHQHSQDVCFNITDENKRRICIKNYEYQFYKKRLEYLRDNATRCKFSKNPVECHRLIHLEMLKLQDKLTEVRSQVLMKYAGVKS